MIIDDDLSDDAILEELGKRLAARRVVMNLTQQVLAEEAGVAKRTVENIEAGRSCQLVTLVRVLRVLGLMENLQQLVPENRLTPIQLLKKTKGARVRASKKKKTGQGGRVWQWQEDK